MGTTEEIWFRLVVGLALALMGIFIGSERIDWLTISTGLINLLLGSKFLFVYYCRVSDI